MAHTSSSLRSPRPSRAVLLAGAAAVLGLTAGCDGGDTAGTSGGTPPDTAASATARPASSAAPTGTAAQSGSGAPGTTGAGSATAAASSRAAAGTRCHTSELRASVGREDAGAGQENFPLVLTNASGRTCTVRGFPGAAFVDGSGKQLGPDPRRSAGTPTTVTLKPGGSAWAGLTFANPEVSGARTATPAALLLTPPDERDPLTVTWTAGEVPVSGNASSVRLTVLQPGTGT
ncbi:DUF4232 domain-containing protein [Streptomyces sp. NPDC046831]|uniref:DUF4232 domain-containing protein n=1 Tax=Streptomyces sp. NPDC046831 TaxID=3154805 RepID=UPI0033CAE69D